MRERICFIFDKSVCIGEDKNTGRSVLTNYYFREVFYFGKSCPTCGTAHYTHEDAQDAKDRYTKRLNLIQKYHILFARAGVFQKNGETFDELMEKYKEALRDKKYKKVIRRKR